MDKLQCCTASRRHSWTSCSVVRHHGGTHEQAADGAKFGGQTDRKTAKAPAHNTCVDRAALASHSLVGPV